MGVLNVTPDSFSDGGRYMDRARAIEHALQMVEAGAAFIDIGGESTRPGAADVDDEEELRRVVPIVEALAQRIDAPISVDTSKPRVIRAALAAGASLINDVRALREPGALEAVADSNCGVCLMHMRGEPRTMQTAPHYENLQRDVAEFLRERVEACQAAGIERARLVIDPGIGFGKTLQHNLELLADFEWARELALPILIGVSRKSMFKALLGRDAHERLAGGLAVAAAAVLGGAHIIRAHDVRETYDAVRMATALRDAARSKTAQ